MRKLLFGFVLLVALLLLVTGVALAETSALDWSLFKIYNSPSWVWGANGAIITPTAEVAKNGVYFNGYIIQTGTYNNELAAFSTNTLALSTGNLEVGLSKQYLLLNFERLDVDSTILHVKFQPFVTKFLNVAIGTVMIQIGPDPFSGNTEEKFFNDVFAVVGLHLGPLSANAGAEMGMIGAEKTEPFYFINGKLSLGGIALIGEAIATDKEGKGGIYNAAIATNNKHINLGIGALDLGHVKENGTVQYTGFASFRY
jgi:hypothetical protein